MSSGSVDVDSAGAADEPSGERSQGTSALLIYTIALAIVLIDQATKLAAIRWLYPVGSVKVLGPYLSFTWATNTGGAFGVLSSSTGLLAAVAIVVSAVLIVVALRVATSRMLSVAVAMVLGGAFGNLIDRLRLGYVVDFIDVHFWPVFNIADITITAGAGLIILGMLLGHTRLPGTREDID